MLKEWFTRWWGNPVGEVTESYVVEDPYEQYMLKYGPPSGALALPMSGTLLYTDHPSLEFITQEVAPNADTTVFFVISSGNEEDMFSHVLALDWARCNSGFFYILGCDMRHIDGKVHGMLSMSMTVGDLVEYWPCDGTGRVETSFIMSSKHPAGYDLYYLLTQYGYNMQNPVYLSQIEKVILILIKRAQNMIPY